MRIKSIEKIPLRKILQHMLDLGFRDLFCSVINVVLDLAGIHCHNYQFLDSETIPEQINKTLNVAVSWGDPL